MSWAQGVGRSNRPAPTTVFNEIREFQAPRKTRCSRLCSCAEPHVSTTEFPPLTHQDSGRLIGVQEIPNPDVGHRSEYASRRPAQPFQ